MMTENPPVILTIAGSDSSAGAGIQADLKTAAAHGVYATTVIANITAQNTVNVSQTYPVSPDLLRAQFEAVWRDFEVSVIKIGLLGDAQLIKELANLLTGLVDEKPRVILDPVMVASSGARFLEDGALEAIISDLLPLCDLMTPNIKEAETFLNCTITSREEMELAAKKLVDSSLCRMALITGGEGVKKGACDVLYTGHETLWFEGGHIPTQNTHGTGCTLSSAIACYLAKGEEIEDAVEKAKIYVTDCLKETVGVSLGEGNGPLFHGFIK